MIRFICCVALCAFIASLCAEDKRPWLGITPDTTTGFDAKVIVKDVKPNSTAEEMGMLVKDIITDLASDKNSWRINGIDDLSDALNQHQVGDTIRIGIERGEEKLTLSGALKEYPTHKKLKILDDENAKKLSELALGSSAQGNGSPALALAMYGLNKTLEQLPAKIEEAAREFKKVYPEGEFILKVEISISSNTLKPADEDAVEPEAENEPPKDVEPEKDKQAQIDGEKQAAPEKAGEKTDTPAVPPAE